MTQGPFLFFVSRIGTPDSAIRRRADDIQQLIIDKAVEHLEVDLDVIRADQDDDPGRISTRIVQQIVAATVVVVDATGRNPNVFYELGIAHAFQKPVVLLADSTDSIPFDTQDQKHMLLADDGEISARTAAEAVPELVRYLETVCAEGYRPTSPVAEAGLRAALDQREDPESDAMTLLLERVTSMERSLDTLRRQRGPWRRQVPKSRGLYTTSNAGYDWAADTAEGTASLVRNRDKLEYEFPLPILSNSPNDWEYATQLLEWRREYAANLVSVFADDPSMGQHAAAIAELMANAP